MDNILENFGYSNNFWKYNPQFLANKVFKRLYSKDNSKNKELSSKIMWGIAFLIHPGSIFKNLDDDDKQQIIASDYIENKSFDWESVREEINSFSLLVLTKARRSLDDWESKLRERDDFINRATYSWETMDELDKALKTTHSMWKQYKEIRDTILEEGSTIIDKGGGKPSLSDEGKI